jgi:hypothetical protein
VYERLGWSISRRLVGERRTLGGFERDRTGGTSTLRGGLTNGSQVTLLFLPARDGQTNKLIIVGKTSVVGSSWICVRVESRSGVRNSRRRKQTLFGGAKPPSKDRKADKWNSMKYVCKASYAHLMGGKTCAQGGSILYFKEVPESKLPGHGVLGIWDLDLSDRCCQIHPNKAFLVAHAPAGMGVSTYSVLLVSRLYETVGIASQWRIPRPPSWRTRAHQVGDGGVGKSVGVWVRRMGPDLGHWVRRTGPFIGENVALRAHAKLVLLTVWSAVWGPVDPGFRHSRKIWAPSETAT